MDKYSLNKTIECRKIKKEMHKHRRKVGELRKFLLGVISSDIEIKQKHFIESIDLKLKNKQLNEKVFDGACITNHLLILTELIMSGNKRVKSKSADSDYRTVKTDNNKLFLITRHKDDGSICYFKFILKEGEL
jgi:hypothetical protein